jgi:protocatechuate 3,4-dioxygenase beta subunit
MNPTLLRETASQTAGPYVHIGLAPQAAGFDIFENNFGNVLVTQLYFEGDPLIATCPILRSVPDEEAVRGLIAVLDRSAAVQLDSRCYRFDITLRGRRATHFENALQGAK